MTLLELTVTESPTPEDLGRLEAGLTEHSEPFVAGPGFRPLAVLARSPEGAFLGGAYGLVNWNWLHLKLLWVSDNARSHGVGAELLDRIEHEARQRGCSQAHLDTFSYQAKPFYEQHGYEVFGTLVGYPTPEHSKFFLRKVL